jgi:hypothetical protein
VIPPGNGLYAPRRRVSRGLAALRPGFSGRSCRSSTECHGLQHLAARSPRSRCASSASCVPLLGPSWRATCVRPGTESGLGASISTCTSGLRHRSPRRTTEPPAALPTRTLRLQPSPCDPSSGERPPTHWCCQTRTARWTTAEARPSLVITRPPRCARSARSTRKPTRPRPDAATRAAPTARPPPTSRKVGVGLRVRVWVRARVRGRISAPTARPPPTSRKVGVGLRVRVWVRARVRARISAPTVRPSPTSRKAGVRVRVRARARARVRIRARARVS